MRLVMTFARMRWCKPRQKLVGPEGVSTRGALGRSAREDCSDLGRSDPHGTRAGLGGGPYDRDETVSMSDLAGLFTLDCNVQGGDPWTCRRCSRFAAKWP